MLERNEEYQLMALVEGTHWWYKALHMKCLKVLKNNGCEPRIKILDAGCGTGGLMAYLKDRGYSHIEGFDLSEIAIQHCLNRGLHVWKQDLKVLNVDCNEKGYDAIFSCDTLYYLSEQESRVFFDNCYELLNDGGLLVVNIPALQAFSGIHDIAVGIRKRFKRKEILNQFDSNKYEVLQDKYWPFILSPLIYLVRLFQRMLLACGLVTKIKSDVKLPSKWINYLLIVLCDFEENNVASIVPFGSSIFLVLRKKGALNL